MGREIGNEILPTLFGRVCVIGGAPELKESWLSSEAGGNFVL